MENQESKRDSNANQEEVKEMDSKWVSEFVDYQIKKIQELLKRIC